MLIIQFTGLSGCGKTTLANQVKLLLEAQNKSVEILDGDQYRHTLCKDLGFSKTDRYENIRRLANLAMSFTLNKEVLIIAAINPYEEIRKELEIKYNAKTVWVNCELKELLRRDTKGLYKRAMLADHDPDKLFNLTGINDIYETPSSYDLQINTHTETVPQSVDRILGFIAQQL